MNSLKSIIIKVAFVAALAAAVATSADAVQAAARVPTNPGDINTQRTIREFYREWYEHNRETYICMSGLIC